MSNILAHMAQRRSVKPLDMHGPGPTQDQILSLLTIAANIRKLMPSV